MWLRPWHVIVCVVGLALALIGCASLTADPPRDILLGLGVNILSSVVFFVLLELYWQRMRQANGKEVVGKYTEAVEEDGKASTMANGLMWWGKSPEGHESVDLRGDAT